MEQTSGCPGLRKGSGQKESRCCCKRTAWGSLVWTDRDVLCLKCISVNILAVTLECGKMLLDLPCSSDGKESACNAGDLGSIPGSGRSPGEGNGHPLQYSCLENPMDRGAWRATVHGVAESDTTGRLTLQDVTVLETGYPVRRVLERAPCFAALCPATACESMHISKLKACLKNSHRAFPGGPVSDCKQGPGFNPWSESQIPQATSRTQHNQINKK